VIQCTEGGDLDLVDYFSLMVVVEKPWFSKSPWDSYTKKFHSEEELLDWWLALPDNSYTKKHAKVLVFRTEDITCEILVSYDPRRITDA
jgi:hypothetical protein